jgi:hypothetical protein
LRLNFRGEHIDIQRSMLTKSKIGWNLFSCLFKKHWDGFHVRDREGRIYIDLKFDGFKSLINCLNLSGTISISNNHLVYHSLKCFEMLNIFEDAKKPWTGLENSQFFSQLIDMENILNVVRNGYVHRTETEIRFVLLDSFNFLDSTLDRPIASYDILFKSLFFLAKVENGRVFGIIYQLNNLPTSLLDHRNPIEVYPLHDDELVFVFSSLGALESKIISASLTDLFPLQFIYTNCFQEGGRESDFEIQRNGKYFCNFTVNSEIANWVNYDVCNCKFERLEIFEIQTKYFPDIFEAVHSNPSDSSFISAVTDEQCRKREQTDTQNDSFR